MHTKKQIGRVIGIILSLFLLFSLEGRAQGGFTVLEGTAQEGHDYTYEGDVLIVKTNTRITISSNSQVTSHRIEVEDNVKANITLNDVNISSASPFNIKGSASVNLTIQSDNTLQVSFGNHAALHCSLKASLTIEGDGFLTANGGQNAAGIGGDNGEAGGTIKISGGTVTATGGQYAAGIGGGNGGAGGNITIEGGTVNATGDQHAAGIGGGFQGAGGDITISGGIVTATGGSFGTGIGGGNQGAGGTITISGGSVTATGGRWGAGIGGGDSGAGGTIKISGGIVTATGYDGGAGIGGGDSGAGGTIKISGGIVTATGYDGGAGIGKGNIGSDNGSFTTTENGNAFIQATSISDQNNLSQWSGVIFEGNTGKVYGKSLTLPKGEITIPSDNTLTIDKEKTLTIEKETTLTNDGVIEVAGTLTNNGGTYQGSGKLYKLENGIINVKDSEVLITFDGNGQNVVNLPSCNIIEKNSGTVTKPANPPSRTDYTFIGWSLNQGSGSNIIEESEWESIPTSEDQTIYAIWKYNTKLEFMEQSYSHVYDGTTPTVEATLTKDEQSSNPTGDIAYSFYSEVECINYIKTSDVKDAGTYYVKASYPGDNNNMEAETAAISYEITEKELTVTPTAGQMIYSDEYPAYTYTGQVGNEKPAFTGDLEVVSQLIGIGNLALVDDIASGFKAGNYILMISSADVAITVDSQSSTDAIQAALEAINSSVGTGWHKGPVTLTPTPGFKIKGSSILKSNTEDWKDALTVDGNDGTYEVTYQLKRFRNIAELDAQATPSDEQTLIVQLDKTAPTVAVSTSDLTATVSLSDATSGLASCTYNWDNGGDQSVTLTQGENTKSFTLTGAEGIYPLKVILTDQAGNEATYVGQVTLKENRPTPPPTPTPIYYTVSLPAVEGAITDPAAGDHLVESWDSFSFTIALDADYSESVPLVTVDGTVLTPRESDGKYIIKWVRHDMAVEISGIVKNNPTGTDDIQASAVDIRQSAGVLCIDTPQPLEGKIYSAAGTELRTLRLSAGTNRVYGLPQGVCIIRLSDETTRKVIIATH